MADVRILVIDDEPSIVKWVGAILRSEGYVVDTAEDGESALRRFDETPPDLVLLDIMLPTMDGFAVGVKIRERSTVPIIILSARSDERDKVRGLRLGADDYLVKPFGIDELIARVEAALRRADSVPLSNIQPDFSAGPLRVDFRSRRVTVAGREVRLTPNEYALLARLVQYRGRVLTHQNLLELTWGSHLRDDRAYLRVYVNRLRRALGQDSASRQYIETIRGVGYRFIDSD